jgi:hypothetical protein
MSSVEKNNTQFIDLKNILNEYHNTFITDRDDPQTSTSYFPEMKITYTSATDIQYTAPDGNVVWNIENFNKFIMSCFNYKISSSDERVYNQFKIKSGATANAKELKDIRYHINTINVIIDILEAYKKFIELESVNFKALINNVNNIQLVNKFCRPNKTATFNNLPNVGYIHKATGESTLVLSITSFHKDNHAFTPVNSTHKVVTSINEFIDGDTLKSPLTNEYLKQTINFNAAENKVFLNGNAGEMSYNPQNTTLTEADGQARDKRIINNLLYFLVRMSKDNIRLQVFALYYYYKLARAYIYMHCATINVSINDVTSVTNNIVINLVSSSQVITSTIADYVSIFLNNNTVTSIGGRDNITHYNIILVWVKEEFKSITQDLFKIDATTDPALRYVLDKSITFIHTYSNTKETTSLNLSFQDSPFANSLRTIIRNPVTRELFINNYILVYNGTQYKIKGANQGNNNSDNYITIEAKYRDYTDPSVLNIPSIPFNHNAGGGTINLDNCKIYNKSIFSLKKDYANNKTELRNLNSNIKFNTVKINNQKNLFDLQKNKYDVLNNQILAYNIILGAVLITFICLFAFNIEMGTKKLISFIICSIIIIIILVYYILSVSYTEESFTTNSYKDKIEHFAISSSAGLLSSSNSEYTGDKMNFLNEQLLSVCTDVMASFQRILGVLPLKDTTDFYNELNNVIELEKGEKSNINDILTYKRSLGNSNIDIMKYEIHNMKVYIFVLLVTAAIFSLLYMVSLFIPPDYGSLLMFVALIVGIIMFSYYIIFTNYLVKTKSMHKYWGPMSHDKF